MEVPLSLLVLAAIPVTGRRLRGAVSGGVSSAATDAVLRVARGFVARRALHACVAAAAVVGVADVAAHGEHCCCYWRQSERCVVLRMMRCGEHCAVRMQCPRRPLQPSKRPRASDGFLGVPLRVRQADFARVLLRRLLLRFPGFCRT